MRMERCARRSRAMRRSVFLVGLLGGVLAFLPVAAADAASARGPLRLHRMLETSDVFEAPDLPGVAFPPGAGSVLVLDWPERGASTLVRVGDAQGEGELALELADPINLAWDARGRRVLAYDDDARELVVVHGRALRRTNAKPYGVGRARGVAVDPATGTLWILDAAAQRVVRIAPGPAGDLSGAAALGERRISALELPRDLGELRGLALDPATGHLFVASAERAELYELDAEGTALAVHDLAGSGEPVAMGFGPSSDRTDDPETASLFVASGDGQAGEVAEYSFTALATFEAAITGSLVQTIATSAFSPPSPDPSGVDYVPSLDSLVICDGEVEEMGIYSGANVWEVSRTGAVRRTFTTTSFSNEPTGAGFNASTGRLFLSDDNQKEIWEIAAGSDSRFGTSDDTRTHFDTSAYGNTDPEGVAHGGGALWIADGVNAEVYRVAPGANGKFDGVAASGGDDQVTHFDTSGLGVSDPEGIAYDAAAGQLLVVGKPATQVARVTTSGSLVEMIDISAANAKKPAGLAYAAGSADPGVASLWIVDRNVDNGSNPNENDGKLYEFSLGGAPPPANLPPGVSAGPDRTVAMPNAASLDGTVSDDGFPDPPHAVTVTWSQVSGPGTASFANRNAVDTTATFPAPGLYALRLTASDGQLQASDDMKVDVTGPNGERVVEIRIGASSDDAEEGRRTHVATSGDDLELVYDKVNQTVGLRFPGVDVPPGATILEAWVQFKADETGTAAATLRLEGQKSANAGTFVATNGSVSSRPRTTAFASWSPPGWTSVGAAGAAQRTPSLVGVIQEIVRQGGWARGNALALIVTGTGKRTAESWDADNSGAPLLHVMYR
jgi:uncharacterized protein YjiK